MPDDSVRSGVVADLTAMGMLTSGEGQAALVLADALDSPAEDASVSGLAAAARELRMLLADMRARPRAKDEHPLDQLKAKRDSRKSG